MASLKLHLERDELATKLGGGLPRGSLVCIEGPTGAGKSVLSQRLAYGLLRNGHRLAYISTELTTPGFAQQMASLDYRVEAAMVRGDLVFAPVYGVLGQPRARGDLLARLVRGPQLFRRDAVFIDTFSKLVQETAQGLDAQRLRLRLEDTLFFLKRATAAGCTVVLALEPDAALGPVLRSVSQASDVLLEVQAEMAGNTMARRLVVQRHSRAASRFSEVLGFRVEPGMGLVVEIKSVV